MNPTTLGHPDTAMRRSEQTGKPSHGTFPVPCPHCRTTVKHGERIACCSGCGVLFTSGTAFERHWSIKGCRNPLLVGLVPRPVRQRGVDASGWGLPADGHDWDKGSGR